MAYLQLIDAEWLRREYIDRHRSALDIATEIGCSEQAVWHALRRHDVSRRGVDRRSRKPTSNRI